MWIISHCDMTPNCLDWNPICFYSNLLHLYHVPTSIWIWVYQDLSFWPWLFHTILLFLPPSYCRRRITVSCSKLQNLLPRIPGIRSDLVTVLEMTIAYLDHIQEFVMGHQCSDVNAQVTLIGIFILHTFNMSCQTLGYFYRSFLRGAPEHFLSGSSTK